MFPLEKRESDVVSRLLQPGCWHWSDSANDSAELGRLHDRSCNGEANLTIWSLKSNVLQIWILASVLLRSAELPLTRVSVSNVLRVISLLSANLTNLGHDKNPFGRAREIISVLDANKNNTMLRSPCQYPLG